MGGYGIDLLEFQERLMRELLFTQEQYADPKMVRFGNLVLESIKNPELMVCA